MSAWLTTDVHVSAMIQAAVVERLMPMHQADQAWKMAKWQNHYAMYCRYGDELPADEYQDLGCDRTSVEAPLDPAVVVRLIECWKYQCSQFEGWDQTQITQLMQRLADHLMDSRPTVDFDADGLPWGIEHWDDVILQLPHPVHTVITIPSTRPEVAQ